MHLPNRSFRRFTGASAVTLLALAASMTGQPLAQAQIPTSGSLIVEVAELKNVEGQVCLSLYDSSAGFPDDGDAVIAMQCVDAADIDTAITFDNLSMGTYAVSAFHDENGDSQLNRATFGIPTEGFGFSRNPDIGTSAPAFYESAVFVFGATTTQIDMIYF